MPSRNFILYGTVAPPATHLQLRAGPLQMLFDSESGFLRRICLGDHEVLRGIYVAVRDRNWGTVTARVEGLKQTVRPDSFELSFAVDCRAGAIHFHWEGQLSGAADGTLRYVFDGVALTTFLKNRIGFCILHPLRECCGALARYLRGDGQQIDCRFPTTIEPQIVGEGTFRNLRSLAHQISPGRWAELTFEGDLFETEDQRNWTDASFKTYGTPLALPFPVEIQAGTRLRQVITFQLRGSREVGPGTPMLESVQFSEPSIHAGQELSPVVLKVPREAQGPMPHLGVCAASHGMPLAREEVARLSSLKLSHLRVDLRLAESDWPQALSSAMTQARQLEVSLELALYLPSDGNNSALGECGAALKKTGARIARVLAFRDSEPASSPATLALVRRFLPLTGVMIGGGTDSHFCELNREQALGRFGLGEAEFISWPITPQVHVFDDLSVMENLEGQPYTVATARTFAGHRPLVISPITLRPRFNAVATGASEMDPARLPPQVDPRQMALFGAAWTLGSIAGLAEANVESLTFFETTGWLGLMESGAPSASHPLFPSVAGMLFPVYSVFAALAGFSQMKSVSQDPRLGNELASLCVFDAQGNRRLLCANLTARELPVLLELGVRRASLRTLDAAGEGCGPEGTSLTWSRPLQQECPSGSLPLVLSPYAIASVDSSFPL